MCKWLTQLRVIYPTDDMNYHILKPIIAADCVEYELTIDMALVGHHVYDAEI